MAIYRKGPRVVAIGAGKGGVGKSVISSNLAIACAQQGRRVVLIDGDLGAPNLHTLLGVGRVRGGLDAFFAGDIARLGDAVADTGIPGLGLVVGAVRADAADLDADERRRLLTQLRSLDADVVILDIGAGTSRNAIEMFLAADHRLVVMVPQLPALQNAYLFLKASVLQTIHAVGGDEVDEALGGEGGTVASGLARLRNLRPQLADRVAAVLAGHGMSVIGNMVTDPHELHTIEAMVRMVRDYLTLSVPVIGSVKASPAVRASIDDRRPLLLDPAAGRIAVELRRIAAAVLESAPAAARLIGGELLGDGATRDAELAPPEPVAELAAMA
jgi:flagellar biosynthesis protein FlhG